METFRVVRTKMKEKYSDTEVILGSKVMSQPISTCSL